MTTWQYKVFRCSMMENSDDTAYQHFLTTIESHLSDGWQLQGGISSSFFTHRNHSGVLLAQAMVKGEETTDGGNI